VSGTNNFSKLKFTQSEEMMNKKYALTIKGLSAQDMVDMYNAVSDLQKPHIDCRILEGWLDSLPLEAQNEIRKIRNGKVI
jgi:hypothetical protein